MRKTICLMLLVIMCSMLTIPAMAASEEPVITLQPQSPNYPEYSVAVYTVKAEGTNLQATWYMEWLGKTYTISDIGGAMQDWEPYAGESYGARKLDDNTFIFVFEGIEYDLDGAYIWCVIEDGHYSVTSQKNRISVGNEIMPPEIVSIPSELTVEQGDLAEIRCVAKTTDGSELSFLWYETDTGKLEDIRAVNRGTETADYLICDTDNVGTRNYVCLVESANGGMTYSSVVAVTVTEKQMITADPNNSHEVSTEDTKPSGTNTETVGTDEVSDTNTTETPDVQQSNESFPWWAIVLLCVVTAGIGFGVAFVVIKKKP